MCYTYNRMEINAFIRSKRSGQVMVEYIIIAFMLLLSVTIFSVLLYTFKESSVRVLNLVGSEYP